MKGARPVAASTIRMPTSDSTTRMGIIHHFLFSTMNWQNSAKSECCADEPRFSNSVAGFSGFVDVSGVAMILLMLGDAYAKAVPGATAAPSLAAPAGDSIL